MSSTASQPASIRLLDTPAAHELAGLAATFDDLQTVLRCCERLVAELTSPAPAADGDLVAEALWTTAVLSYARCFAVGQPGVLTEDDVRALELPGDVLEWHKVLQRMREHFANPAENPREQFSVGATQGSDGLANGIAITSTGQPRLDDVTVRQTGALAYALSKVVDERITERQEGVRSAAGALSKADLDTLPLVDVAVSTASASGGESPDSAD